MGFGDFVFREKIHSFQASERKNFSKCLKTRTLRISFRKGYDTPLFGLSGLPPIVYLCICNAGGLELLQLTTKREGGDWLPAPSVSRSGFPNRSVRPGILFRSDSRFPRRPPAGLCPLACAAGR